jgi:branched-chain amino acid aminotransferase
MELAVDEGLKVQFRPISINEIIDGNFSEIAACGTAVVVTPVNKIVYKDKIIDIVNEENGNGVGPVFKKLYDRIRRIQNGDEVDKFNWLVEI